MQELTPLKEISYVTKTQKQNLGKLNITDWFYNYDNNGEVVDGWKSSDNIKWVFTYRKGFYQFPDFNNLISIEEVQPLKGLNTKSVEEALNRFSPSKDFITEVIQRGQVL